MTYMKLPAASTVSGGPGAGGVITSDGANWVASAPGYIDVSKAPYRLVPNDRSQAVHNTTQLNLAIVAALATKRPLIGFNGDYHVAWNGLAADGQGWKWAITIPPGAGLSIIGSGMYTTSFIYCSSAGDYDCIFHTPENADKGIVSMASAYTLDSFLVNGYDPVSGHITLFGIKFYGTADLRMLNCCIVGCAVLGADFSFALTLKLRDCSFINNYYQQLGIGCYGFNGNAASIENCFMAGPNWGLVMQYAISVRIEGGGYEDCQAGAILMLECCDIDIRAYFESCGDTGQHYNGTSVLIKADVVSVRGYLDTTVPAAWNVVMDPRHPGGSYWDNPSGLGGGGISIRNSYINHYSDDYPFVATNCGYDIHIEDCQSGGSPVHRIPSIGFIADYTNGVAMPFSVKNCSSLGAPVVLYGPLLHGQSSYHRIGETDIDYVSRENLLSADVIGELTTRSTNYDNIWLDGELSLSTTATGSAPAEALRYNGKPTYRLSGKGGMVSKCKVLDVDAEPRLRGALVVMSAKFYISGTGAVWPTQTPQFAADNGTSKAYSLTSLPFADGWHPRTWLVQLPMTGTMKLGFSMLADGEAFFAEPAIHFLGAPYEEVIAGARNQTEGGWITAADIDLAGMHTAVNLATGGDGVKALAGLPIYAIRTANAASFAQQADGSGFLLWPNPSTTFDFVVATNTAPLCYVKLKEYIPNYRPDMQVRFSLMQPTGTPAASGQAAVFGFWDGTAGGSSLWRGWTSAGVVVASFGGTPGVATVQSSENVTWATSNAAWSGVARDMGHNAATWVSGQSGTSWPALWEVRKGIDSPGGITTMTSDNACVFFGAQASGGVSVGVKYTRLKIEYKP